MRQGTGGYLPLEEVVQQRIGHWLGKNIASAGPTRSQVAAAVFSVIPAHSWGGQIGVPAAAE